MPLTQGSACSLGQAPAKSLDNSGNSAKGQIRRDHNTNKTRLMGSLRPKLLFGRKGRKHRDIHALDALTNRSLERPRAVGRRQPATG